MGLHVLVDKEIRDKASKVCKLYGLTISDAVRFMLIKMNNEQRIPFSMDFKAPLQNKN
jgi:addiction module RelB/DinJ family antitoxin